MPKSDWLSVQTFTVPATVAPPDTARIYSMVAPVSPAGVTGPVTLYSTLTAMEDDGWTTSHVAYNAMGDLLAQTATANQVSAIRMITRQSAVAEEWSIDVTGTTDGVFALYDSGVVIATFTASTSTATQIKDGLIAATIAGYTAATVDTDTLTMTQDVAGIPIVLTQTSPTSNTEMDIGTAPTIASVGIYDDLVAAYLASPFWGVLTPGAVDLELAEALRWVQGNTTTRRNFYFAENNDVGVYDPLDTDNLAAVWKTAAHPRVNLRSHPTATDYTQPASIGRLGGAFPGSRQWHYLAISGFTETTITSARSETDTLTMRDRSISYTERLDGPTSALKFFNGVTSANTTGVPAFIYHRHAEDWIWFAAMAIIDQALASALGVNINEAGLQAVSQELEAMLAPLVNNDVIADDFTVSHVPIADIPAGEVSAGDLKTTGGWIINVNVTPKLVKANVSVYLAL